MTKVACDVPGHWRAEPQGFSQVFVSIKPHHRRIKMRSPDRSVRPTRFRLCLVVLGLVALVMAAAPVGSLPVALADQSLVGEWHLDQLDSHINALSTTPDSSGYG